MQGGRRGGGKPGVMLAKLCVFCGAEPRDEFKQRVLPEWLLELSGDARRVVPLGLDWETGKSRELALDEFQLPACSECGERNAALEGRVAPLMARVSRGEGLLGREYGELLDWFDKLRIGLWLGHLLLFRNPFGIAPNFASESRLGSKDRILLVVPIDPGQQGLTPLASWTPAFQLSPGAFGLVVNGMLFVNLAADFLIAKRAGFPYPISGRYDLEGRQAVVDKFAATRQLQHPLLSKGLSKPSVFLAQAIFQGPEELRQEGYFQEGLFLQRDGTTRVVQPEEEIEFEGIEASSARPLGEFVHQILECQNTLLQNSPYKLVSSDPKALANYQDWLRLAVKFNKSQVDGSSFRTSRFQRLKRQDA